MATRQIRHKRVKSRLKDSSKLRLSIFKSSKYVFAQLIDDSKQTTLLSVHSKSLNLKGVTKVNQALAVGKELGKLAIAQGLNNIVFDRGGFLYHGRVEAVANGAREAGLIF